MAKRIPIIPGSLIDHQVGTDDVLIGLANATNFLVGDAGQDIRDHATGGNDTFTGGVNSIDNFVGDAGRDMLDHAVGGNDRFTDLAFTDSTFYGDAGGNMSGYARGGDDTGEAAPALGAVAPHISLSTAMPEATCPATPKAATTVSKHSEAPPPLNR
ncbi:hypothetical protein IVA74_24700, partial [Bradyrhizobium sp. 132]|nr:hypothetical protein [Bradyrhizobium sp. 132]